MEEGVGLMRALLEKEAHSDLVEKRKRSEADLEKVKVLKDIEALRYEEEQKTIRLREDEKKKSEAEITAMHKDKIAFEAKKKEESDLKLLSAKEESEIRIHNEKASTEKELKKMEMEQRQ